MRDEDLVGFLTTVRDVTVFFLGSAVVEALADTLVVCWVDAVAVAVAGG